MALDATFFATGYADIRCQFDDSGATTGTSTSGSWITYDRGPCGWLIFLWNAMFSRRESGGTEVTSNEKDPEYGYAWAKDDGDSSDVAVNYIYGDYTSGGWYGREGGEGHYPWSDSVNVTIPTGGSNACSVWCYMPLCWDGRVAPVIASILRNRGLSSDYIDMTAFSAADDGQIAIDVDEDKQPHVFYRREIGQTYAEAIKELARNCWDLLSVTMAGKVALWSRNVPAAAHTISGLDDTDGVTAAEWRIAYEHMANRAVTSHGRWYLVNGDYIPGTSLWRPTPCSEVAIPSTLGGDADTFPLKTYEDTTAQTKYGVIEIGSGQTRILQDREEVTTRVYHLPYLMSSSDVGVSKDNIMARLSTHESQARREVTVTQDFQGLDYDAGYFIEDVDLTGDGDTFDAFCIAKTIDFRKMQVTSTLFEEL